jgi:hypothetical protein
MHLSRHSDNVKGGRKITKEGTLQERQTWAVTSAHDGAIFGEDRPVSTGGVTQM